MDRLLFGDNQFFGVNHMSEEKARAQAMRFQAIDAVIDVLDAAYDEGVRTFMCTTHDRIAEISDHVRADPERYADLAFYPCMPYAHKYANAVTEDGMLGAVKRFLPGRGSPRRGHPRRHVLGQEGHRGIMTLLDRRRDEDVPGPAHPGRLPAERGRRPPARPRLRRRLPDLRRPRARALRCRAGLHHDEPAALLAVLDGSGIENPIVCANINKLGFRMCGGVEAYERALRERSFRAIAMSVFASGAIPAEEAIEWVCAQPNLESIVFGASSARNIQQTRDLVARHWDLETVLT